MDKQGLLAETAIMPCGTQFGVKGLPARKKKAAPKKSGPPSRDVNRRA
jgi:hypothetical protein